MTAEPPAPYTYTLNPKTKKNKNKNKSFFSCRTEDNQQVALIRHTQTPPTCSEKKKRDVPEPKMSTKPRSQRNTDSSAWGHGKSHTLSLRRQRCPSASHHLAPCSWPILPPLHALPSPWRVLPTEPPDCPSPLVPGRDRPFLSAGGVERHLRAGGRAVRCHADGGREVRELGPGAAVAAQVRRAPRRVHRPHRAQLQLQSAHGAAQRGEAGGARREAGAAPGQEEEMRPRVGRL